MTDWRCPYCQFTGYTHIDERKPDGSFGPGPDVRCINCKRVYRWSDASDIVERLRGRCRDYSGEMRDANADITIMCSDLYDAADEIERLRARAEELDDLAREFKQTTATITRLRSERDALRARVETQERALIKEREERLWLAARAVLKETKEARKEPDDE